MEAHVVTVFECRCTNRYIYLPHEDAAQGVADHLFLAHGIRGGRVPPQWQSRVRHWTVYVGRRMTRQEARQWWLTKGEGQWTRGRRQG